MSPQQPGLAKPKQGRRAVGVAELAETQQRLDHSAPGGADALQVASGLTVASCHRSSTLYQAR
jgi:hypothetical protein